MKKILFMGMLLFFAFSGFTQTQKGSWLLGGSMSFTTTTEKSNGEKSSYDVFNLNPKVGFFPIQNLAVILNTDYTSLSYGGFSDHVVTIGPAVRYYFTGSDAVKFFAGAGVGFASATDSHGTNYQFEAGPSFFITRAVALEVSIKYETGNVQTDAEVGSHKTDMSRFGVGIGFMIFLGSNKK